MSESGLKKYADEQINKYIEKLREKANKIYQQYSKLSKESTIELNFLLGDMEFISGIKPYKKIYEKMYQPLFNILDKIKEECYHFNLHLEGKGNEAVVLEKLFNLQRELFTITEKENDEIKSLIVMGTFVDNMLVNLEEFRADMYNIKPEEQKAHPIICVNHNKNS